MSTAPLLLAIAALLTGADDPEPLPHVLYCTHAASYFHQVLPFSARQMRRWAEDEGAYTIEVTDDVSVLEPDVIDRFDALVFYTNRELPMSDAAKQALLDFVADGGGFVAIHSGTGTFFEWPPYHELINGLFDGHPWHEGVTIQVEQPSHPLMQDVPAAFEMIDEIYQHKKWSRARTHVLAHLDMTSVDPKAKGVKRTDNDFALAWAHRYGEGRVYVNALGHTRTAWEQPEFRTMIVNGIRWSLGQLSLDLPASARTGPAPQDADSARRGPETKRAETATP